MNNSKLISPISNILENASKLILDFYKNKNIIQSSLKQDSSPVTEADKRAHIFITKELLENFPLIPVISEEGDEVEEIISDLFWLVDPLDGTKEFINQGDDFTINIALINNQEPVFGAIYIKTSMIMWIVIFSTRSCAYHLNSHLISCKCFFFIFY